MIPEFKMNNGMKAYVAAQRNKVSREAPKRKTCPKCHRERLVSAFGVRTHRNPETGKPERFSLQSYCNECRAGKVTTKRLASPAAKAAMERVRADKAALALLNKAIAALPAIKLEPVATAEVPA